MTIERRPRSQEIHADRTSSEPRHFVDLHTHLRGTITPSVARRLAAKHGVELASDLFDSADAFRWSGFPGFLHTYAEICSTVKDSADLLELTKAWLIASANGNTIYSEIMISPAHVERSGIELPDQLAVVRDGIDAARDQTGIEARVIATCIRHHGPEEALKLARRLERLRSPVVVGFGLTGDEHKFESSDFAPAFQVASGLGLGCTAHVGEWRGAKTIIQAVRDLKLNRIGHGLRAVDDAVVLNSLVGQGVGWEICLSSNLRLKYNGEPAAHPLKTLLDHGCKVAFGTDDPGFFNTTPEYEYRLAGDRFGLTAAQLSKVSIDAIEMAFCDANTKKRLQKRLLAGDRIYCEP